jgi:dynein heavy chain, axonemal
MEPKCAPCLGCHSRSCNPPCCTLLLVLSAVRFPSLVSCTTIDWFTLWPDEALKSVAARFLPALSSSEQASAVPVDVLKTACMLMHTSMRTLAEEYRRQVGLHVYVTPTSYLQLLITFRELHSSHLGAITTKRHRYEVGLQKLLAAESEVNTMQLELLEMQPKLIEAGATAEPQANATHSCCGLHWPSPLLINIS